MAEFERVFVTVYGVLTFLSLTGTVIGVMFAAMEYWRAASVSFVLNGVIVVALNGFKIVMLVWAAQQSMPLSSADSKALAGNTIVFFLLGMVGLGVLLWGGTLWGNGGAKSFI